MENISVLMHFNQDLYTFVISSSFRRDLFILILYKNTVLELKDQKVFSSQYLHRGTIYHKILV